MASSLNGIDDDLAAQWLAQMKAMRDAIADLKLPQLQAGQVPYGQDILVEDESSTLASSGDDLWDLIESDEDEAASYSSDDLRTHQQAPAHVDLNGGTTYNTEWLEQICVITASRAGGLDANDLQEQIRALLVSDLQGRNLRPPFS